MLLLNFVLGTKFQCGTCGQQYKNASNLGEHQRLKCGKEPTFICPFCKKKFYYKRNLQSHLISCRKHHQINDEDFTKVFRELFKLRNNKQNRK